MILEDLICTNIMQRGVGNVNPMKMAKCIQELERIKGIRKGGNRKSKEDNPPLIPQQEQLASELGISQKYLQEMKKLTTLIPELQTMIENGSMKATVGYKIWSKMAKCIQELERIKGIRKGSAGGNGSNQYVNKEVDGNNFRQANLANQIGLDERQLRNYKQLNDFKTPTNVIKW